MTARKVVVTLKKDGFATEAEADDWGKAELDSFVKTLNERRRLANENK